jgi:hypothetical protein
MVLILNTWHFQVSLMSIYIHLQVDCLREHVTKCGLAKKVELVIVSPLLRYSFA